MELGCWAQKSANSTREVHNGCGAKATSLRQSRPHRPNAIEGGSRRGEYSVEWAASANHTFVELPVLDSRRGGAPARVTRSAKRDASHDISGLDERDARGTAHEHMPGCARYARS